KDVERDRRRHILAGERQRLLATVGDDAPETLAAGDPEEDAGVMGIVLDDEQDRIARFDALAIVGDRLFGLGAAEHRNLLGNLPGEARGKAVRLLPRAGVLKRQVERERRALRWLGDESNLAAEQGRQLAADRQAEARASVLAAGA